MKLLYATSAHYPSPLANRIQILAMASAFSGILGANFALGVPEQSAPLTRCRLVKIPGSLKSPFLGWRYARIVQRDEYTHVFCREERLLFFIKLFLRLRGTSVQYIFEAHWLRREFFFLNAIGTATLIIAITDLLKQDLVAAGASEKLTIIAPDGVDLAAFEHLPARRETRRHFHIPEQAFVVGYTGSISVHSWKGVTTLLHAVQRTSRDVFFWVVGGDEKEIASLRKRFPNVRFEGQVPHTDIPAIQSACDALILPNSGRDEMSVRHTSPLKLFEYMASGTPIIASDLPSTRAVISEQMAVLIPPDDPTALGIAIEHLASDSKRYQRAGCAKEKAAHYTWDSRARFILSHLEARPS